MKFDEFNKLVHNNRMILLIAIDLLMQNGRRFVLDTETSELISAMKNTAKNLFAEYMLKETVDIAKELAPLRTCEVLDYVKRSDLQFKKPGAPESGICPICGDSLEYGADKSTDDGGVITWICSNCGATGEEHYKKIFDKHSNVFDGEGCPFPPSAR